MTSLLDSIQPYAELIGVAAALIIFASWLVENLVARRLRDFRDTISRAQDDLALTERFFHLERRMLDVYAVAASANSSRTRDGWTYKDELIADVERLQRIGGARQSAHLLASFTARTKESFNAIDPPAKIDSRVRTARSGIRHVCAQLDSRRDSYRKQQKAIAGNVVKPDRIKEEQARKLSAAIARYQKRIESTLDPALAQAAKEIFRSYEKLFDYAHQDLARRENTAAIVARAQLALFISGSIVLLLAVIIA